MIETDAKGRLCPFRRGNLCAGSLCMAWRLTIGERFADMPTSTGVPLGGKRELLPAEGDCALIDTPLSVGTKPPHH